MDPKPPTRSWPFFLGAFAALVLAVSLPELPVAWWALTLAVAYDRFSFRGILVLTFLGGTAYAAFSSVPWWLWVLPQCVAVVGFHFWQRPFTLQPLVQRVGLLIFIWVAQTLGFLLWGWGILPGTAFLKTQLFYLSGTLVLGLLLVPLVHWFFMELWRRLPKPRTKVRELNWLHRDGTPAWRRGRSRKPFGLERTI